MCIEVYSVTPGEEVRPVREGFKAIVYTNEGALAFADAGDRSYHVVCLEVAIIYIDQTVIW